MASKDDPTTTALSLRGLLDRARADGASREDIQRVEASMDRATLQAIEAHGTEAVRTAFRRRFPS